MSCSAFHQVGPGLDVRMFAYDDEDRGVLVNIVTTLFALIGVFRIFQLLRVGQYTKVHEGW